jgi:nicotinate-nucleotide pyrophosphorylase (carboxylating)
VTHRATFVTESPAATLLRAVRSSRKEDLRDQIFASLEGCLFTAEVRVTSPGLVCGVEMARNKAEALGCIVLKEITDGDTLLNNTHPVLSMRGPAKAIAMAEDCVPGAIAKFSGIARAARNARGLAGSRVKVVSGATKKMPDEIKAQLRRAIHFGGGSNCISDRPFLYLDKNYVRMFGGVRQTLAAVTAMQGYVRVIQLRGLVESLPSEARAAIEMEAEILMVDTGRLDDLDLVSSMVRQSGRRESTTIAFAGDIAMEEIPAIVAHDVDILDVGRAIIDAPMIDIKVDVVAGEIA